MKKLLYYIKILLFIVYLIFSFLSIDKLFTLKPFGTIYFIINLIYIFITIISILSKKKVFIESISYNLLNISLYIFATTLSYITLTSSKLIILSNSTYYKYDFVIYWNNILYNRIK